MSRDLNEEFEFYAGKVINRKQQFDQLVNELRINSDYFNAPASPRYHCDWDGGLLEHSLNVTKNAIAIKNVLAPGIPDESCVVCGLFHDLGKAPIGHGYYKKVEPTSRQAQYGYVAFPQYKHVSENSTFMTVPQRSLRDITRFVYLEDFEYQAILIHDGQYVDENTPYKNKENPFALILHYADSFASMAQESTKEKSEDGKSYFMRPPIEGIVGGFDANWIA